MKAAVLTAFNEPIQIEEVSPVALGPRDVLVRVDASGVCHSDLHYVTGATTTPLPLIIGHEGTGTVLETGAAVTRVRTGDRVISSFIPACGDCWFCLHDQSYLCERGPVLRQTIRAKRTDGTGLCSQTGLGTFAEAMTVDEAALVKVETDLPSEHLALIGCGVTTGVGAVLNTAKVEPGRTVAVIGCGGVGQAVIQGARIAGAARIFAIDPVALKRQTALSLGATDTIDPTQADPVEQLRAATQGRGVDYAFEVIGLEQTMLQAYQAARRGGTAVMVGMPEMHTTVTLPASQMFREQKRILGCLYGSSVVRRDFPRMISLAERGLLNIDAMVSRRIRLEDVGTALKAMQAGEVIRSVVVR